MSVCNAGQSDPASPMVAQKAHDPLRMGHRAIHLQQPDPLRDLGVCDASFFGGRRKYVNQVMNRLVGQGDELIAGLPLSASWQSAICLASKNPHMENEFHTEMPRLTQ